MTSSLIQSADREIFAYATQAIKDIVEGLGLGNRWIKIPVQGFIAIGQIILMKLVALLFFISWVAFISPSNSQETTARTYIHK